MSEYTDESLSNINQHLADISNTLKIHGALKVIELQEKFRDNALGVELDAYLDELGYNRA